VPEGHNLNHVWWIAVNSVIQVVTHTIQVHAADIPHPNIAYKRANVRLSGDERDRLFEILSESSGCFRAIFPPPDAGLVDMPVRPPRELDR
jgi:hypothetical protein